MKNRTLLLIVIILCTLGAARAEQWLNLSSQPWADCSALEGDNIWFGGWGGLVKFNTITGVRTHFNKLTSDFTPNYVGCIRIDTQGRKWIGTNFGLFRFDGATWVSWNTANSAIPSNDINDIAFDAYSNVWIATDNGLGKLSNNSWNSWTTSNSSIPTDYLNCLDIDNSGNVWLGTYMGLYLASSGVFTQLNQEMILCMKKDQQGNRWFGTGNNGLARFDGNQWTYYNPDNSALPDVTVDQIDIDISGNIWIICEEPVGLVRFDGINWTIWNTWNSALPIDFLSNVITDQSGNAWISVPLRGIVKLSGNTMSFHTVSQTGIVDPDVNCVLIDDLGRKWVGSEYGLALNANGSWQSWDFLNIPNLIDVSKIAVDSDHNVWIDSDYGFLCWDGTSFVTHNAVDFGLLDSDISLLTTDNQDNLWIGGPQRLVKRLNGTNVIFDSNNSPLTSAPTCLKQDLYGNLWVGTTDNGLLYFNGVLWSYFNTANSGIPANSVNEIDIDSFGNLWIATQDNLSKFDGSTWTHWNSQNTPMIYKLSNLEIDSANRIWMISHNYSTYKVVMFDGTSWSSWNHTNSPLSDVYLTRLFIDGNDNVWITTGGTGVFVFNTNGIVENSDNLLPTPASVISVKNYPNPFRQSTIISYNLPKESSVKADVFNLKGQHITTLVNQAQKSGEHQVSWDGFDTLGTLQPSGVYIVRIQSQQYSGIKKLILVR
ncbi:MAG: T9SS type A sorting domain-containing protein [Candidatus Cloacimonetes bacterium]|nr:T9SS type A sorting domain-containing protein [Candidatus Cloacimonadota bacterium]MDD2297532.1 T9SS type A sorting domain-containing protein [Sphaerochaetaceae bacterium]